MKTLFLASALTISFAMVPAYADSEASPPQATPASAQEPVQAQYLYGTPSGTSPPAHLYNAQQSQGTWLFPPNPSGR